MFTLLTLFSGSLGLSLVMTSQWWFWLTDRAQTEEEEEEDLTHYQTQFKPTTAAPKSANPGWEFKIVRSHRHIFHRPETLKKVCQEEAQGGWVLLEKLDDRRLRFKRPMNLRDQMTTTNTYDPYRSFYGSRWSITPLFSGMIVLVMTALPAYLAYRLVTLQLNPPLAQPTSLAPPPPTADLPPPLLTVPRPGP